MVDHYGRPTTRTEKIVFYGAAAIICAGFADLAILNYKMFCQIAVDAHRPSVIQKQVVECDPSTKDLSMTIVKDGKKFTLTCG